MKGTMFTGARPTGALHLGHYFGALKEFIQHQDHYDSYFIISDLNMMTTKHTKKDMQDLEDHIINMVIDLIGIGLNPDKTAFFIQSQIPEISSIYLLLQNFVTIDRLNKIPSIIEMANNAQTHGMTLSLFGFSVLVSANILGAQADFVPLGKDAVDHLTVTQDIITNINLLYGSSFKMPAWNTGSDKEIIGLDGNKKMSKSLNNCIFLRDQESDVNQKIDKIKWHHQSPDENPAFVYLRLLEGNGSFLQEIQARMKNGEDMEHAVKEHLKLKINALLNPIRKRAIPYEENKDAVRTLLEKGRLAARSRYADTLQQLNTVLFPAYIRR